VGIDHAGHAHPPARQFLHDQRVGQQRFAQPAELLGDHQPEDPHFLHLRDDFGGVFVGRLQLGGDRKDRVVDEIADRREHVALHVGEIGGIAKPGHGLETNACAMQ